MDLAVRRGEVVAILGPNGAGKTTAISILLGLRAPTSGSVTLFGGAPDEPATKARVGAMLQESGVPGTLTVAELIDLFRGYYPAPRPRTDLLAVAGLEDVADRRVRSLSGGQRQRLYVALALAGNPEVVFLDEPTTGMDVESRRRFWDVIGALAAEGRTIIFATHLLEEADALATRIVVIDRGRVVRDGTPAEIKARAGGATIRLRADVDPGRPRRMAGRPPRRPVRRPPRGRRPRAPGGPPPPVRLGRPRRRDLRRGARPRDRLPRPHRPGVLR